MQLQACSEQHVGRNTQVEADPSYHLDLILPYQDNGPLIHIYVNKYRKTSRLLKYQFVRGHTNTH